MRLYKPVILTKPDEIEQWMTAPAADALKLQRPLPDASLKIVAPGAGRKDSVDGLSAVRRIAILARCHDAYVK